MPAAEASPVKPTTYDYALIRVVPRVERGEFINVGVIVACHAQRYLAARFELIEPRLLALDPTLDLDALRAHLQGLVAICDGGPDSGPIGRLPQRERFHWLVAPRSTVIQTSPVHTGHCSAPGAVLDRLMDRMVRPLAGVDATDHAT